jgi:hypothetical protein
VRSTARLLCATSIAVAAAAAAGAAAAAVHLTISPAIVHRGGTIHISGNAGGCGVGSTVFVISRAFVHTHEFAGVSAVLARVRAGGVFRATTVIPRGRRPARYNVTARCGGGNLGVLVHVTVRR